MNDFNHLENIEQRLSALEAEAKKLRLELEQAKAEASSVAPVGFSEETTLEPVASVQPFAPIPSEPVSVAKPVTPTITPTAATQKAAVTSATPAAPKTSSRFEDNLGGKVMGIVAAILVFIGLFLFGSVLYERLGDTARIALLFLVSFLLLGAGLFLERRRSSWFTTSLIGCGFGAIYISLFLTALYFGVLSKEGLYLLLLLWYTGIGIYVFKRHSYTVASLGQVGITISVLFGCPGADSIGLYNFLCVYFVAVSLLYLWIVLWRFLPTEKSSPLPCIYIIAAVLNTMQLLALSSTYNDLFGPYGDLTTTNWFAGILLCVYSLALPIFYLLRNRLQAGLPLLSFSAGRGKIKEEQLPLYRSAGNATILYGIYQFFCSYVFIMIAEKLFISSVPAVLFYYAFGLLLWLIFQLFGFSGVEGRGPGIVFAGFVLLYTGNLPTTLCLFLMMLFAVIFGAFGWFSYEYPAIQEQNAETKHWQWICRLQHGRAADKFLSLLFVSATVLCYAFGDATSSGIYWLVALFGLLYISACFYLLYGKGRKHLCAEAFKVALYFAVMLHIFWLSSEFCNVFLDLSDYHAMPIILIVLTVANSIAFYSPFRVHLKTGETNTTLTFLTRCFQTILWIWGIAMLRDCAGEEETFRFVCLLLLTMFLCGSGMYEQYKLYRDKTGIGIYFGLKITIYLLAVLTAFEAIPGYVISCALLLLAILSILAGFKIRLAPLRVYGLCLAMFAVIKLLMADLEHDNSMETVLCFLGAGALCFAINFIYNHMKKHFKND